MAADRRVVVGALMLSALLPGCATALPQGSWPQFKARFTSPEGRVIDTGNRNISHSEGQGYGMLFAVAANDRQAFDRMLEWSNTVLRRPGTVLYAWRYDPAPGMGVSDPNNATDGDILVAWALMQAARRWRDDAYARMAQDIRAAILRELTRTVGGRTILLPAAVGFEQPEATVLNLAYYVWPALDDFARADPGLWDAVITDGIAVLGASRFGRYGLPSDWIQVTPDGSVAPAADRPPRFGFDAIRIPLYLAWGRRTAELSPFQAWWRGAPGTPAAPAWIDVVTNVRAEYPLSAGGQAVLQRTLGARARSRIIFDNEDYYSVCLSLLTQLSREGR